MVMRDPDVAVLPLLRSTAEQDDNFISIFAEIHAVSWAKIDFQLENTCADAFDLGLMAHFQWG